jgi:diketogulonate reductase-like aldo/keto reductase
MTSYPLNDGHALPQVGLGTYSLTGAQGAAQIADAIRIGYRLIDTAVAYGNEDAVGDAVRESGVPRDEVLITSKVPEADHGYDATKRSFERTLSSLGMDRIELYLIHWPAPERDRYVDTWRAMIDLQAEGRIVSIGVSNFDERQLQRLIDETGVTPAVNQVPLWVGRPQEELRAVHERLGVLTESYSPLKHAGRLREDATFREVADAHGRTVNQVALRWNIQLGALPIPRSRKAAHQAENLDLGFELSAEEVQRITALRW